MTLDQTVPSGGRRKQTTPLRLAMYLVAPVWCSISSTLRRWVTALASLAGHLGQSYHQHAEADPRNERDCRPTR